MPIRVTDYDREWPRQFELLRGRLLPGLSDLILAIEHVGSTSVPELAAKPILDIDIVIASAQVLPEVVARLAELGYVHQGDRGVPGREAFRSPAVGFAHHLYVCLDGCPSLRNHLAIRDRLRRDPQAVAAYGALKKQLAADFPEDIDAYVEGKTALLVQLLREAGFPESWLAEITAINRKPG